MKREHIIERFCALASRVASEEFGNSRPSDCFCHENQFGFQFSPAVLDFIETAVTLALETGTP